MQLTVDGAQRTFTPLPAFRQQWGLPPEFCIACFEPKDWQGLGSLDGAGEALDKVKRQVVNAVPRQAPLSELSGVAEALTGVFRRALVGANEAVGLREQEIDFAVAGFQAITQAVADQLFRLCYAARGDVRRAREAYRYDEVYRAWLDHSVEVSGVTHTYAHGGAQFDVRVIYYAYGRIGMEVRVTGQTHYVLDTALACPAASYMKDLCQELGEALCEAVASPPLAPLS